MHLTFMGNAKVAIFDEKYRVISVESQCLVIRGVKSGKVLTIMNPDPETPLSPAEYPPGKLIALSDPSAAPLN
jgi:hypothetical protein